MRLSGGGSGGFCNGGCRKSIKAILQETCGDEAELWFQRWRVFIIACAELFGYNNGKEWFLGHHLLKKFRPATHPERNNNTGGAHHAWFHG